MNMGLSDSEFASYELQNVGNMPDYGYRRCGGNNARRHAAGSQQAAANCKKILNNQVLM
jgi:hypothetical protein